MELKNKFNILDDAIVCVNELADARGVDKCVRIVHLIQNLNELGRMLKEEDAQNEAAIRDLTKKIDEQNEKEAGEDADIDAE